MLELLDRQQKLTANQWKIALAATIGDMLDFFDFFLIGFVLAFIVGDWHLTYGQSGMILLASGVSAPFGSLFYGWLADKIGRRKVMIATVLNFSLATGAMASNARWRMDLPCHLPLPRRSRRDRPLLRRHHGGAGVRAGLEARLADRTDHDDAAGRRAAGGISRRIRNALHRLARPVRCRATARAADALHPRLGSRIRRTG